MSPPTWFLLLCAGAVGAVARHLVQVWLPGSAGRRLPWGTLAVNVAGSLLLGLLIGLARRGDLTADALVVLGVGFCGAFTTFATFAVETVGLAEGGRARTAAATTALNVVLAAAAAAVGLAVV